MAPEASSPGQRRHQLTHGGPSCVDKIEPAPFSTRGRWSFVSASANRECGRERKLKTAAAPATVSGEPAYLRATGFKPGKAVQARTREPGDLPSVRSRAGRGASA